MALERELRYYEEHKEELLKLHAGKFVLIKGDEFGGCFDSSAKAYQEGLTKFGNTPFLIRRVAKEEPIEQTPALDLGVLFASS